ncbi:hypothetical protein CRUP_035439 [Coryphaenoides rupestris]|nr:hypothetical protein CRUP_035439 [Coryphaenoides rupestris]
MTSRPTQKHHHRHQHLDQDQDQDQNLQFMLGLYRSAAGPGRQTQAVTASSAPTTEPLGLPSAASLQGPVHYLGVERQPQFFLSSTREAVSLEPPPPVDRDGCHAHVSQHILREPTPTSPSWPSTAATDPGYFSGRLRWTTPPGEDDAEEEETTAREEQEGTWHLVPPGDAVALLYLEEQRRADWLEELLAGGPGSGPLWGRTATLHNNDQKQQISPGTQQQQQQQQRQRPSARDLEAHPGAAKLPPERRASPATAAALHSFRLSFEDLGLGTTFIAPPVYNPRYCQGECPPVLHAGYHSPYHAIIQTVMRELAVGEDVPAPSCVPYKYMPMSVLVHHKSRVEYRELEDMIAESCTCR